MAVEWGYLKSNPIAGVKQLKEDNEKMWVLTPDEEQRLLNQCDKSAQRGKKRYLKDMVKVALYSGCSRPKFSSQENRCEFGWALPVGYRYKTTDNRTVPINDTLLAV